MPNMIRQVPEAAASPDPEPEARAVHIEHEFITLTDIAPPQKPNRVVAARLPSTGASRRPVTPLRTLAQKARRALLGDGRHRPEPFPAARQPWPVIREDRRD
jgi:hypothetical protein